jgi:hypothetical protein
VKKKRERGVEFTPSKHPSFFIFSHPLTLFIMPLHYDTPRKAKVQGAYQFLVAQAIPFDPRDIFKQFEVFESVGYKLIQKDTASRRAHHVNRVEKRGRKSKVTCEQVREADHLLQDYELDEKRLT